MGEILLMLVGGGGATAIGALLKGVFGFIFEGKRQKHEMELARECRANDNFIKLQAELGKQGVGEFTAWTRRILAIMGTASFCTAYILCVCFPTQNFLSVTNASGEGTTEILWGLISFPASQDPIVLSSGHLAFMAQGALMGILGFYFAPSPRR
jgi:hypothetical protein